MGNLKLKGKDLRKLKFSSDKAKSIAAGIMAKYYKHFPKTEQLDILKNVLESPLDFLNHETLGKLAHTLVEVKKENNKEVHTLENNAKPYRVFGKRFISDQAIEQMETAMRLPVAVGGAMMPDAHSGYGLPIGGVLATENAVIPYGVGLDIGCRMSLTLYDTGIGFLDRNAYLLKTALKENTHFGMGRIRENKEEHEILDRPEFQMTDLLRKLHGKARLQLGSSGSGNHFVEFGTVQLKQNNTLGLPDGEFLGILAHSGSRGLGATIAQYFTRVAMDLCHLPKHAQNLAWLDLNGAEGQEYWLSMQLAGDYAKACHDVIHRKLAAVVGIKPLFLLENHHNFAWKERQPNGQEWIVHRKGATPAGTGVPGIIPGSMTQPGYIVSGKGSADALHSASHGAGRKMSRTKTKSSVTGSAMKKVLKNAGVTLIGGGIDEAPMAYKNLDSVMESQRELVNVEGTFTPKIVRMDRG